MSRSPVEVRLRTLAAVSTAVVTAGLAFASSAHAAPAPGVLTGTVTGTVTGADGRPLAGVTVAFVVPNLTGGGQQVDRSTTTNAAGRYTFSGNLTTNDASLQFLGAGATGGTSATGYGDVCYGSSAPLCWIGDDGTVVQVRDGRTRTIDVALPRAGVLTGRAVDTTGRSVGSLPFTVWPGNPDFMPDAFTGPVANGTTDSNGNYRLRVSAYDGYSVCFGQPGVVSTDPTPRTRFGYAGTCLAQEPVTRGGTTVANATIQQGAALTGTVVDDRTGQPVPGATITVYTDSTSIIAPPLSATSSATGTVRLFGLDPGAASWCVDAQQYRESCSTATVTLPGGVVTSIGTVRLTRAS